MSQNIQLIAYRDNLQSVEAIKNSYYSILLCEKGTANIKIGLHQFKLKPNMIAILSPGIIFSINQITDDLEVMQINFTKNELQKMFLQEEIIEELLTLNSLYPPAYELYAKCDSVLEKFKQIKVELTSKGAYYLDIVRLKITEILYEYNRACEFCLLGFDKNMNRNYQVTYEFKKLVEIHFTTSNSIGMYASKLGISAKHLKEVIKEETGTTALQLIHERLLLESQYLLKHTTLSIKECAALLGFETSSYFSRFFKAQMACSPSDFRKNP